MPPTSPPRHPCEEENLEPYSLIVVVCSGKIQLQHKASCYRGHDYSNILIFPVGVHCVTLQRSDLQGGVHLAREHPTEAIRHKVAHPSAINREVIRRTISYVRRALDPNPNVLMHGA